MSDWPTVSNHSDVRHLKRSNAERGSNRRLPLDESRLLGVHIVIVPQVFNFTVKENSVVR